MVRKVGPLGGFDQQASLTGGKKGETVAGGQKKPSFISSSSWNSRFEGNGDSL